jgi:hypothetical protein
MAHLARVKELTDKRQPLGTIDAARRAATQARVAVVQIVNGLTATGSELSQMLISDGL